MPGTLKQRLSDLRERRPLLDRVMRTFEHYGQVNGNALAAAVTYFAFLSFFPIMALAFAVIGKVAVAYPDARADLVKAIGEVLPGMIGDGPNEISLATLERAAPGFFGIGILLTLYSGLGWLSGMRQALVTVFEEPERERPNFVMGKIRDVLALILLGAVLVSSVTLSGVVTRFAEPILDFVGLGRGATALVWLLAIVLGLAASAVLFFAFFRLLASPDAPARALWSGALLGAVGFELLKQASSFLLASTKGQPAFQAFGIALVLVVWMNYFSRVVVLAAAWAHTSPQAQAIHEARVAVEIAVKGPGIDLQEATTAPTPARSRSKARQWDAAASFAAGAAAMLGAVALVRKRK